jgi:transcriptional regulator with XRE-family HTH domain
MNNLAKSVGERIKTIRGIKGFTQEVLAERSGLALSLLSEVERGTRNITLNNLEKILIALEVTPMEFFQIDYSFDKAQIERRKLLGDFMRTLQGRSNEEIKKTNKLIKEMFEFMDLKND